MNRMGWRGAALVFAAVDAGYVWLLSWSSPRSPGESLGYWIPMAVMATPAAFAGALLWCAWWLRSGVRLSTMDAPAALLATAVATLPADRRDWGMAAELAQVPARAALEMRRGACPAPT